MNAFQYEIEKGCKTTIFKDPVWLEPSYQPFYFEREIVPETPSRYDSSKNKRCFLKIVSSVTDEVTPENTEQLLRIIKGIKEPVSFEIIGSSLEITFLIVCQRRDKNLVISGLETQYKNIYVEEIEEDPIHNHYQLVEDSDLEMKFNFLDYYLPPPYFLPILTFKGSFNSNPLEQIYHTLSTLKKEELGFYQVLFMPTKNDWHKNIRDILGDREAVEEYTFGRSRIRDVHPFLDDHEVRFFSKMAYEKADPHKPFFAVSIRTGVFSLQNRFEGILKMMRGAMNNFASGERSFKYLTRRDYYKSGIDKNAHRYIFFNRVSFREGMLLNSSELAGLCHLPTLEILQNSDYKIKSIQKSVRAPDYLNQGVTLGLNIYRGIKREVKLNREIRNKHLYLVGKTRMGKSTLMLNLIHQDIINGECVVAVDPEGLLIEEVLNIIPHQRMEDVVYFNAGDKSYPMGFNLLHAGRHREKGKLCNDILFILEKLFEGGMSDRMKRIFRRCLFCLLYINDSILKDVELFLTNDAYRNGVLSFVQDRDLKHFWQLYFPNYKRLLWSSVEAILTRLDGFLGDEIIRNITCQRANKIDFDEILEEKKIFLCNLNTKSIGEVNANILGQLIVSELQIAGMHREKDKLKDVFFYVDEFQNYITPDFQTLLSQGAKYRVNLCLAHQYVEQLKELKGAVFGNVGSLTSFRLGERDAATLAKEFGIFDEQEILHLPEYHALVKVEDKSFTMVTKSPPETDYNFKEEIIQKSRGKYNTNREKVEKEFKVEAGAIAEVKPPRKEPKSSLEDIELLLKKERAPTLPKVTGKVKAKIKPPVEDERRALSKLEKNFLTIISKEEPYQDLSKLATTLEIHEKKLKDLTSSLENKGLIEAIKGEGGKIKTFTLTKKGRTILGLPSALGKGGEQHKYFQGLIKWMAEDKGYRVNIEDKIPGGMVDVSLELEDLKIACEISVTSSPEQELGNIEKCLKAGFNQVILCSPEQKFLDKIQELAFQKFESDDQEKVSFLQPGDIHSHLEKMAIPKAQEELIKGRKVETEFKPVTEKEEKAKREAITQVILKSLRRLKGEK